MLSLVRNTVRSGQRGVGRSLFSSTSSDVSFDGPTVSEITVQDNGVHVKWDGGEESFFHNRWLLANCPTRLQEGTGQVLPMVFPANANVSKAQVKNVDGQDTVEIGWSFENHKSSFQSSFLKLHDYSLETLKEKAQKFDPLTTALRADDPLPRVRYSDVMDSDESVLEWTTAMEETGLCVVDQIPAVPKIIRQISDRIAPPIVTLYGEIFDVRVEQNAINIAYTAAELEPHMDLAYYESPPGIQMLHCVEFCEDIIGGESTFFDTFVLAEILRSEDPEAFDTLCRVPATFQKNHIAREHPAQMLYQRPHFTRNSSGDLTATFWSPPFEGPLNVPAEDVEPYYRAYDKFNSLFNNPDVRAEWKLQFRLKPGEMIAFNQRRMLHGRNKFSDKSKGLRHLQGIYIDIDDYLNRHRYLKCRYGLAETGVESVRRCGNASFSWDGGRARVAALWNGLEMHFGVVFTCGVVFTWKREVLF